MAHEYFDLFYWKSKDQLVIGIKKDCLFKVVLGKLLVVSHTKSRMPKTLVYLGEF